MQRVSENILTIIVEEGTRGLEDAAAVEEEEAEEARSKNTLADHYHAEECSVEDHTAMIQEEEEEEEEEAAMESQSANTVVGSPDFVRLRYLLPYRDLAVGTPSSLFVLLYFPYLSSCNLDTPFDLALPLLYSSPGAVREVDLATW
jgi:hypothetical protein